MDIYDHIKRAYKDGALKEEIMALYSSVEDKDQTFYSEGEDTLLHLASQHADPIAVGFLLKNGVKTQLLNKFNYTPLRSLCNLRDVISYTYVPSDEDIYQTTCLLLDANVSTLKKDESGNPCAVVAAERGLYPMIKALIDKQAKIGMTGHGGKTPLHAACEEVRHEINSLYYDTQNLEERRKQAEIPNHSSYFEQVNKESLEQAEKRYQQTIDKLESYYNIVKLLVENGFDPETKNDYGDTPLDYAVKSNAKKIGAFLKWRSHEEDLDRLMAGGMSLHQAAKKNDAEAIRALLRLGEDPNEVIDTKEFEIQTPLAVACEYIQVDAAQVLLDGGADPNFKSGEKGTPAIYWLIWKSEMNLRSQEKEKAVSQIVKNLLAAGWHINDFINDEAYTAFALSCKYYSGKAERIISQLLLDEGCDINIANHQGQTPFMFLLTQDKEVENLLISVLENGALLNAADKGGKTPLMYAVSNHRQGTAKNYIEIMSQFGSLNVQAVNNEGKTAIEMAVDLGYEEVVKQLLDM